MSATLGKIIDVQAHPLADPAYRSDCKARLDRDGALLLHGFLRQSAIDELVTEATDHAHQAYYCEQTHSVYLDTPHPGYAPQHPANRQVTSSKGCITDDQVPPDSALRVLYASPEFREFLCEILGESALFEYADPLSSINVHYYREGQELGWHFDNSAFAVTLMLGAPDAGGEFEYIPALRNYAAGDMNYPGVERALDGHATHQSLDIRAGTLALFRGRNALHRVTPVIGNTPRIQVVLAYNTEPGIALSESARMTFYGRVA